MHAEPAVARAMLGVAMLRALRRRREVRAVGTLLCCSGPHWLDGVQRGSSLLLLQPPPAASARLVLPPATAVYPPTPLQGGGRCQEDEGVINTLLRRDLLPSPDEMLTLLEVGSKGGAVAEFCGRHRIVQHVHFRRVGLWPNSVGGIA